jgi:hypothetical protein
VATNIVSEIGQKVKAGGFCGASKVTNCFFFIYYQYVRVGFQFLEFCVNISVSVFFLVDFISSVLMNRVKIVGFFL